MNHWFRGLRLSCSLCYDLDQSLVFVELDWDSCIGDSICRGTGRPKHSLFGTGQGNDASPVAWLTIITVLLASLQKLVQRGMRFTTPNHNITVEPYSDAFVDDTQNGLTDSHLPTPWTPAELTSKLEAMSQTWEKFIFCCSGGALELLGKCFYYIVYWKWVQGLPQ